MFYQLATDGTQREVPLQDLYTAPFATPCWIIGGGPSLKQLSVQNIAASPVPKFSMNLAGHGLLRPNFWTSYDPTSRFQRSIYLDPSIIKFIHRGRAMDLVPESTYKVCEAPGTLVIDRNRDVGFQNFLGTSVSNITDWQDSLIQTIDIAYRLGFRELYLAGTEMFIPPSPELIALAKEAGVTYAPGELLKNFTQRLKETGVSSTQIDALSSSAQYHFDEQKHFGAAVNTDFHYFRVAQYLRLARTAMAARGLKIVSVTPHSRLNDYFPFETVDIVISRMQQQIGDPANESTNGLYTRQLTRQPDNLGPMRDFKPHYWSDKSQPRQQGAGNPHHPATKKAEQKQNPQARLQQAAAALPEIPILLNEAG